MCKTLSVLKIAVIDKCNDDCWNSEKDEIDLHGEIEMFSCLVTHNLEKNCWWY
jgi:hypothetical protein